MQRFCSNDWAQHFREMDMALATLLTMFLMTISMTKSCFNGYLVEAEDGKD